MLSLFSPAKLNLFLRILRKREDGFHELASLFQTISLGDTLHFTHSSHDTLTTEGIPMPTDSSNLILKAIKLFRKKTNCHTHLKVHAEKHIPLEAGLGGGSSNAATTLWAINELSQRPATIDQLISWSAELGSDVAFFLSQGTAYCTGRGEIIQPLNPLPQSPHITIVKPPKGLSTPLVYKTLKVNELTPRNPKETLQSFYNNNPHYYNDLETPALSLDPSLQKLKNNLQQHYQTVVLAGSGSSFFCIGNTTQHHTELLVQHATFIRRQHNSWYEAR